MQNSPPDALASLLRAAGRRPAPPVEDRDRVFAASRAAWQRAVTLRRRRRLTWALAATFVAAAAGLTAWSTRTLSPAGPVATVELARGEIERFDAPTERWISPLDPAMPLAPGTRLRTATMGRLALHLANGATVRVSGGTELVLTSESRLELRSGVAYAHNRGTNPVTIGTPLGTVIDIGTQFEVAVQADILRTRVRSGSVRLERAGAAPVYCEAGEQLSVTPGRAPVREAFAPDDEYWSWLTPLSQPPVIEGLPLRTFLVWAAEELGRHLRFATPDIEARTREVRLHGSIDDLTPLQALDNVLVGTSFSYVLRDDGSIYVTAR